MRFFDSIRFCDEVKYYVRDNSLKYLLNETKARKRPTAKDGVEGGIERMRG